MVTATIMEGNTASVKKRRINSIKADDCSRVRMKKQATPGLEAEKEKTNYLPGRNSHDILCV